MQSITVGPHRFLDLPPPLMSPTWNWGPPTFLWLLCRATAPSSWLAITCRTRWGPFIYYVSTCRGHGGMSENCNFSSFSVLNTCLRREEEGQKSLKMYLRIIWMVPKWGQGNSRIARSGIWNQFRYLQIGKSCGNQRIRNPRFVEIKGGKISEGLFQYRPIFKIFFPISFLQKN